MAESTSEPSYVSCRAAWRLPAFRSPVFFGQNVGNCNCLPTLENADENQTWRTDETNDPFCNREGPSPRSSDGLHGSMAEILISAAKKLVAKAEIAISAREIDVSAAPITVSRADIIASRLWIMMCGPDMTASGADITVSRLEMIVAGFLIIISAAEISISVTEILISARHVRNWLIPGVQGPAGDNYLWDGNKYLRSGNKYLWDGDDRRRSANNRVRDENECVRSGNDYRPLTDDDLLGGDDRFLDGINRRRHDDDRLGFINGRWRPGNDRQWDRVDRVQSWLPKLTLWLAVSIRPGPPLSPGMNRPRLPNKMR